MVIHNQGNLPETFTLTLDDTLELVYAQTTQVIPAQDLRITLKDTALNTQVHAFYVENDERLNEAAYAPNVGVEGIEEKRLGEEIEIEDTIILVRCIDDRTTPRRENRIITVRLQTSELLETRPIGIDQAELVVITARTREDDPPDVFLGRSRRKRYGRHRRRQGFIGNILIRKIEGCRWDKQAK